MLSAPKLSFEMHNVITLSGAVGSYIIEIRKKSNTFNACSSNDVF